MISFANLWEKVSERIVEEDESKATIAIKTGLHIRDDFWEDFMRVANNREALAELLDVTPQEIAVWPIRIKEHLEKVKNSQVDKTKVKVLDTGTDLGQNEEL